MSTVKAARIDADGVYWGMEDRDAGALRSGDVVFFAEQIAAEDRVEGITYIEGDCDNLPGRYRWNAVTASLEPLAGNETRLTPAQPLADRALYELCRSLETGGMTLPPATAEWADWYRNTMDNR